MQKNLALLEVKVGENTYQFTCLPDSPLGQIHDALSQMRSYVVKIINSVDQAAKPQESEPVVEPPTPEV